MGVLSSRNGSRFDWTHRRDGGSSPALRAGRRLRRGFLHPPRTRLPGRAVRGTLPSRSRLLAREQRRRVRAGVIDGGARGGRVPPHHGPGGPSPPPPDREDNAIAWSDDRPDDWNFQILERLPPGRYSLRVEPVGTGQASTVVSFRAPREVE